MMLTPVPPSRAAALVVHPLAPAHAAPAADRATMPTGVAPSIDELASLALRPDASLPRLASVNGNRVRLLVDEGLALPDMLGAVRGAKQTVDLAMFSLADTGAGKQFIDALIERAKAGVAVRVTIDQVGSMALPIGKTQVFIDRLRAAGVDIQVNDRVTRDGLNAVDHRKILIIDGTTAYVGGMNLSSKFGKWHDVMARVDGPAVRQLSAHFVDRWVDLAGDAKAGARAITHPGGAPTGPGTGAVDQARSGVGMLINTPGRELAASDHLLHNLSRARDRAWILTPTLTDPAVVQALKSAAQRGVDTRVAVSGPEGWIGTRALRLIGSTFYRELVRAGVQVYEQPGMSHAKVSLIDDVASVGSLNMTRRAMLWDHEIMLASDEPTFLGQIEQLFRTDLGKSTLVTHDQANALGARAGELIRVATGLKW